MARRRNPALITIDIIASIVLLLFCGGTALLVLLNASSYSALPTTNGTLLSIVVFLLMAIAVLGLFIAFGMVIVNLIRKRYTFWWPLGGIVVILGLFYLGTWIISLTVTS